ncbi:MAG: tRNA pseudouridine(55) synthase TruB [Gammaproteobacteria bacterium]
MPEPTTPLPDRAAVDGVMLLDKPLGLSSNVALQRARRLLGAVKAGHTGSLDPLATGMLPLCFGEATKVAGYLLDGDKRYAFRLSLGQRTTTGDAEGEIAQVAPVPPLTANRIETAMAGLRGTQWQVPPMYSALKREGRPLYELARQGIEVPREPRQIHLRELTCTGMGADWVDAEVLCSKGTYVRVLGESLAEALGTVGHLAALRRCWVAPFAGRPMVTLEELAADSADRRVARLLPAEDALVDLPAAWLTLETARALARGQHPGVGDAAFRNGPWRLFAPDGSFLGLGEMVIGEAEGARWHAVRLFAGPVARFAGSG